MAPAASRASFAFSASSFEAPSNIVLGAPSTRSLASLRPKLVRDLTSLITWIFLSPAPARCTSKLSFSSTSPAPSPAAAGAAARRVAAPLHGRGGRARAARARGRGGHRLRARCGGRGPRRAQERPRAAKSGPTGPPAAGASDVEIRWIFSDFILMHPW
mgnify:CR=1 FL=1